MRLFFSFLHYLFKFLAVLDLCCCPCFFLVAASGGCSLLAVHRLLIAVASLVEEHRLGLWRLWCTAP